VPDIKKPLGSGCHSTMTTPQLRERSLGVISLQKGG